MLSTNTRREPSARIPTSRYFISDMNNYIDESMADNHKTGAIELGSAQSSRQKGWPLAGLRPGRQMSRCFHGIGRVR